jgi:hypothetical protein
MSFIEVSSQALLVGTVGLPPFHKRILRSFLGLFDEVQIERFGLGCLEKRIASRHHGVAGAVGDWADRLRKEGRRVFLVPDLVDRGGVGEPLWHIWPPAILQETRHAEVMSSG